MSDIQYIIAQMEARVERGVVPDGYGQTLMLVRALDVLVDTLHDIELAIDDLRGALA